MIRIICAECKNAYLRDKGDKLVCPSCEATYTKDIESLLLGIQYYKEENYAEADNCFMKYIVKNGTEPLAIFYKAFCDARSFDEDTLSLNDTYKKILDAFNDVVDEDFPKLIALANDEAEKIEQGLAEIHIRLFADADAEKIKKQVETILNIQKEANEFRNALTDLVFAFNQRSPRKLSVKFSDCFFVESEIAAEVGNIKYQKICDNIASHTVFTGILTNDIKNLEIYMRCIVMFFQKSYDKYKFLLEESNKFTELSETLELGQYNTIKGTGAIADKLKAVSYEFLQESYKEHFDEQIDTQTETVVILEPEVTEEELPQEETAQEEQPKEDTPEEKTTEEETIQATETTQADETTEEEAVEETVEDTLQEEGSQENEISQEVATEASEENLIQESTEESVAEESFAEFVEEAINEDTDIIEIEVEETVEETPEIEDISSTTEIEVSIPEEPEKIESTDTPDDAVVEIPVDSFEAETITETIEIVDDSNDDTLIEIEEVVLENFQKVEADEAVINGDDQKHKIVNPKKKKSRKALVLVILLVVFTGLVAGYKYVPEYLNNYKYEKATALAQEGNYFDAVDAFKALGEYSDSAQKAIDCEYNYALKLEQEGKFAEAKIIFENLGNYGDSKTRVQACAYSEAKQALEKNNFKEATKLFTDLGDYGDSKKMVKECSYKQAISLIESKDYKSAIEILTTIKKYSDSKVKILEAKYMYVTDNFDKKNKTTVKYLNELTTAEFRNSADLRKELLGSSEVMPENIKVFVNYSSTDIETALTELDNTRTIYFHAVVGDKSLYGKTLTVKYTTAFGYSQRKNLTLSESDNVAVMSYPSTPYKNYTVDFELLDSNGQKIAGQKISF